MENLKSIKNILIDVDNKLCGAETAIEKGKFQSTQLYDDFSTTKTEFQKVYDWDKCRIMSEILFDYVVETETRLKAIREAWETLWNQEVKKDSGMIPTRSGGRNSE